MQFCGRVILAFIGMYTFNQTMLAESDFFLMIAVVLSVIFIFTEWERTN